MEPSNQLEWMKALEGLALTIQKEMVKIWKSRPEMEEDEEVRNALLKCRSCKVGLYQEVIKGINQAFGTRYIFMAGSLESHFESPYKEE